MEASVSACRPILECVVRPPENTEVAAEDRIAHLLAGLNEPQRAAVTHESGPLLVLAGRRLGKDAGPDASRRLARADRPRPGERDPGDHVHEQGRAGDARPRRDPARPLDARDVGPDLPQRVRADPALGGRAPGIHAAVHDLRRGRQPAARQAVPGRARASTRSASRPGAIQHQISDAKNKLRDAAAYRQLTGGYFEQTVGGRLRALRAAAASHERDGLRRPARPDRQRLRAVPGGAGTLRGDVPPRAGRRVPGHEPRAVPAAAAALPGRCPRADGRRRRCPVGLRLPGRGHPQHPRLPGRLPERRDGQARAELPLDADDPQRGQRGDLAQPRTDAEAPLDGSWARAIRSSCARSTTSMPRRGSSRARSSGSSTRGCRARRSPSSTA